MSGYFHETKNELKQVRWPNREQAINFTLVVIVLSIFIGLFLGFFDYFFALLIKALIF